MKIHSGYLESTMMAIIEKLLPSYAMIISFFFFECKEIGTIISKEYRKDVKWMIMKNENEKNS